MASLQDLSGLSLEAYRRPASLTFEADEHLPCATATAGYVLTTFQPPPALFLSAYTSSIVFALQDAFSEHLSAVHIYDPSYLHVTIATLHPFMLPPPSSPSSLIANINSIDFPAFPFQLKPCTVNVGSKAVIIRFSDSSHMMSRLRSSILKEKVRACMSRCQHLRHRLFRQS